MRDCHAKSAKKIGEEILSFNTQISVDKLSYWNKVQIVKQDKLQYAPFILFVGRL